MTTTTALINGLAGGLVATIVMTVLMMALGDDSPPPTALFWSEYVGDGRPEEYMPQGMVLHFLYGLGAGVVFAVGAFLANLGFAGEIVLALVGGLVWGIILFLVFAVFWMNVILKIDAEREQVIAFVVFHLAYGLVLGAVVGLDFF